ncbi:hypothetical protein MTR_3g082025 [Medicago truncatula]|uniref:Uncharacterized protein n=1 Tax=Medicago truncatula TaxID=3880 RepID=A0A072V1G1_MEDTR|nr:hypothetical protein MTR_3g082025 [Medicago truncatula]
MTLIYQEGERNWNLSDRIPGVQSLSFSQFADWSLSKNSKQRPSEQVQESPESLNHQQIHQILCNSQRFNTESSSLNHLLHNTSASPLLLATDSSTITKKTVRRRGKENEESGPVEKRKNH